jgi:hypothetical protein
MFIGMSTIMNNNANNNNTEISLEQPSVNEKVTTTFIEQRNIVVDEGHPYGNVDATGISKSFSMAETPYGLQQTFQKPILLAQVPWNTTQEPGANIYGPKSIPSILTEVNSTMRNLFRIFAYYKLDIKLRFQLNSTPFNCGRIIAWFNPLIAPTNQDNYPSDYISATGYPHVLIDASTSTVAELVIPFQHIQTYFTTNTSDSLDILGTLNVQVLNTLRVGEGASVPIYLAIYIMADISSLHVTIPEHEPIIPESSDGVSDAVATAVATVGAPIKSLVTGIPIIGGLVDSALSGLSRGFGGLDAPENPVVDVNAVPRAFPSISRGAGPMEFEKLSLVPATSSVADSIPFCGTGTDEMDLNYITKIPMLVNKFYWTTALQDNAFWPLPVSPLVCWTDTTVTGEAPTITHTRRYYPSYLAYFSSPYCFWRGGIKFRFDFISTPYHTGRILFFWVPNGIVLYNNTLDNPPTLQEATMYPHVVFDLKLNKEVELTVPYDTYTPMKRQKYYDDGESFFPAPKDAVNSVKISNDGTRGKYYAETCNGVLMAYILTPLSCPNSTAQQIDINIYMYAADDYEVRCLRNNFSDPLSGLSYFDHTLSSLMFRDYTAPPPPGSDEVDCPCPTPIPSDEEIEPEADLSPKIRYIPKPQVWPEADLPEVQSSRSTEVHSSDSSNALHNVGSDTIPSIGNQVGNVEDMHLKYVLSRTYCTNSLLDTPGPNGRHLYYIEQVMPTTSFRYDCSDLLSYFSYCYRLWAGGIKYLFTTNFSKFDNIQGIIVHCPEPTSATLPQFYAFGEKVPTAGNDIANLASMQDSAYHAQIINGAYQSNFSVVCPYRSPYQKLFVRAPIDYSTTPVKYNFTTSSGFVKFDLLVNTPFSDQNLSSTLLQVFKGGADDFRLMYLVAPPSRTKTWTTSS